MIHEVIDASPLPVHRVHFPVQQHIHSKPGESFKKVKNYPTEIDQNPKRVLHTSKLLFLAVESCNAFTHISATSAQLMP